MWYNLNLIKTIGFWIQYQKIMFNLYIFYTYINIYYLCFVLMSWCHITVLFVCFIFMMNKMMIVLRLCQFACRHSIYAQGCPRIILNLRQNIFQLVNTQPHCSCWMKLELRSQVSYFESWFTCQLHWIHLIKYKTGMKRY